MFGLWTDPLKQLREIEADGKQCGLLLKAANRRIEELEEEIQSIYEDMAGEDI